MVLDLVLAAAEGDVHQRRLQPLEPGERLDVRADLQQRAGLGVARELGVHDLVAPGPERARRRHLQQEVGEAEPAAVEERRLVDDVVASSHGGFGLGGGLAQARAAVRVCRVGLDPRDPPAVRLEVSQIARLVPQAALLDDVQLGVVAERAVHQARQAGQLQGHQVLAGEEADEVAGGEDGLAVDQLHAVVVRVLITASCRRSGRGELQRRESCPTRPAPASQGSRHSGERPHSLRQRS
jgi:hypothetical protein